MRSGNNHSSKWRDRERLGFSLVEILVVIGIIAMLIGLLLPSLARAREQANKIKCASNLRNLTTALNGYLNDWKNVVFWRAPNLADDGVEFYVYGGREDANSSGPIQQGIFNSSFRPVRPIVRPLNLFMSNNYGVFQCPDDDSAVSFVPGQKDSNFGFVGTSYIFNCTGTVTGSAPPGGGFAGRRITRAKDSSNAILFFDACLMYDKKWHPNKKGNIAMADGHVVFDDIPMPGVSSPYNWGTFEENN